MPRNILIFGAQGSGKGTQAELLAQTRDSINISTGNIFRQEISKNTLLGETAKKYIDRGKLVPNKVVNEVVAQRLKQKDVQEHGFILDGYPRNKIQAKALDTVVTITDVIVLDISDNEAVGRISQRLSCVCGKTYHKVYNPPQFDEICDDCGEKLFVRDDDKPESIRQRLATYHKETEPIFEFYKKKGIVHRIHGEKSITDVYKDITEALGLVK